MMDPEVDFLALARAMGVHVCADTADAVSKALREAMSRQGTLIDVPIERSISRPCEAKVDVESDDLEGVKEHPMWGRVFWGAVAVAMVLGGGVKASEMYLWTDEQGVVHMTNQWANVPSRRVHRCQ